MALRSIAGHRRPGIGATADPVRKRTETRLSRMTSGATPMRTPSTASTIGGDIK
jgi:hypothetical protein